MARAKNTERSAARRRARASARAEREPVETIEEASEAAPEQPRQPFFRWPNILEDIRLLPQILTSRRLMAVPPLVLLSGFVLTMLLGAGALAPGIADMAALYIYFLFIPQALLTFFLGGFLAPRGSYLVGLLLGLLNGLLWAVLALGLGLGYSAELGIVLLPEEARLEFSLASIGTGAFFGTFAAAFAAWYRDFLRRMQEQGRARRAQRDAQDRAKRREQRQDDRKSLKQRSSR